MTKRRLISLYTGAGGLDLGFEAAGFETAAAVEIDADAVATLRANRDWPVLDRDIHTIGSTELLETAGLAEGEADALIGGPPCQPFSKSGYWASGDSKRLDDPRAGTLGAYLRVLRDAMPRMFLLENVPGLAYNGKSEGIELIERTVTAINRERGTHYRLTVAKLSAADYGIPQLRERVFVIGSREGREFRFPAPTHADPAQLGPLSPLEPYRTAWDALGDLEDDDNPESRSTRQVGRAASVDPRGRKLPLAHRPRRRHEALRVATALLDLPAQARQGQTLLDDPGPARPRRRPVPLEKPAPLGSRALSAPDDARFLPRPRAPCRRPEAGRERRPLGPGRGARPRHAETTVGRSHRARADAHPGGSASHPSPRAPAARSSEIPSHDRRPRRPPGNRARVRCSATRARYGFADARFAFQPLRFFSLIFWARQNSLNSSSEENSPRSAFRRSISFTAAM